MTIAVPTIPADTGATADPPLPQSSVAPSGSAAEDAPADALESWREIRDNSDIQFEEIQIVPPEPYEPGWFEEALAAVFGFLGDLLAPIGQLLGISWPVLQWILLALVIVFVLYLLFRTIGPLAGRSRKSNQAASEPEWQPDQVQSAALLEDADRLAAEGRFDEATHLLLRRSVRQISDAHPDWVDPSSTARELAALPALSDAARSAFATISQRVERSLFALRSLERADWEAARSAYANFALARIEGRAQNTAVATDQGMKRRRAV